MKKLLFLIFLLSSSTVFSLPGRVFIYNATACQGWEIEIARKDGETYEVKLNEYEIKTIDLPESSGEFHIVVHNSQLQEKTDWTSKSLADKTLLIKSRRPRLKVGMAKGVSACPVWNQIDISIIDTTAEIAARAEAQEEGLKEKRARHRKARVPGTERRVRFETSEEPSTEGPAMSEESQEMRERKARKAEHRKARLYVPRQRVETPEEPSTERPAMSEASQEMQEMKARKARHRKALLYVEEPAAFPEAVEPVTEPSTERPAIDEPFEFTHKEHVGWDPKTGEFTPLPPFKE